MKTRRVQVGGVYPRAHLEEHYWLSGDPKWCDFNVHDDIPKDFPATLYKVKLGLITIPIGADYSCVVDDGIALVERLKRVKRPATLWEMVALLEGAPGALDAMLNDLEGYEGKEVAVLGTMTKRARSSGVPIFFNTEAFGWKILLAPQNQPFHPGRYAILVAVA